MSLLTRAHPSDPQGEAGQAEADVRGLVCVETYGSTVWRDSLVHVHVRVSQFPEGSSQVHPPIRLSRIGRQTCPQSTQFDKISWREVQEAEEVGVKPLAGRALHGSPAAIVCLITSWLWVGAGPRVSSLVLLPQLLQVQGSYVVEAASVSA